MKNISMYKVVARLRKRMAVALSFIAAALSSQVQAQSSELEAMERQLESMTSCQISLDHERCDLDILDQDIADLLRALHGYNSPGFSASGSSGLSAGGCFDSSVQSPTPFMGNNGEVFKLSNGTIGEVVAEYEYLYEYYPSVTICPAQSLMIIAGKKLNITLLSSTSQTQSYGSTATSDFIESRIDDDFEGYDYGNIYKLRNGQIWEQTSYRYKYKYKYAPSVTIYKRGGRYQMLVDGLEESVTVERLN